MIESFLQRCDHYRARRQRCGRRPWSEARLSTVLFDDGKKLALLRDGRDLTTRSLSAAHEVLDRLEAELDTSADPCARPQPAEG